jgi:hypothetical protein
MKNRRALMNRNFDRAYDYWNGSMQNAPLMLRAASASDTGAAIRPT